MFEHAELKISRAKKHVEEFNSEVRRYIDENPHTVLIKFDPHQGCDVLELYGPQKPIPQEVALPIGDAIHNLRTALDFIWYEFVSQFATPSEHTKFPFRKTRTDLAAALNGRNIPPHLQGIEDFILDAVKPYKGSDTRMWDFHNLDITDKHEYLIPQLRMTTVRNVRAEDQDGNAIPLPRNRTFIPGFPPSAYHLIGYRNVKITDNGQLTANVLFHKGPLRGWPVADALSHFSKSVSQILEGFRVLFGAFP